MPAGPREDSSALRRSSRPRKVPVRYDDTNFSLPGGRGEEQADTPPQEEDNNHDHDINNDFIDYDNLEVVEEEEEYLVYREELARLGRMEVEDLVEMEEDGGGGGVG